MPAGFPNSREKRQAKILGLSPCVKEQQGSQALKIMIIPLGTALSGHALTGNQVALEAPRSGKRSEPVCHQTID